MAKVQEGLPNSEQEEFGPGKKGYLLCPEGKEVYFQKSWRPNLESIPELNENMSVKFELCPVHQMMKDRQYEGEVVVENVDQLKQEELVNLIKNRGEEAERRDTMHRILKIEQKSGIIRVETSENQLAQKIGKAIESHYKKAELKIQQDGEPSDVVHIRVVLP